VDGWDLLWQPSDARVEDYHHDVAIEDEVQWLYVSVDDTLGMSVF
jgi:hypothetical protein